MRSCQCTTTCMCVCGWVCVLIESCLCSDWQASIRPSRVICNLLEVWPKFPGEPEFLVQEGSPRPGGKAMGLPEPAGRALESTSQGLGFSHLDSCGSASFTNHGECVCIMCLLAGEQPHSSYLGCQ